MRPARRFYFRLALALGMPVGELLNRISSQELTEWMAYYALEPFGEERADLRAGIVASTVANTARDPKKRARPYRPQEFMPTFDRQSKRQTWQQQLRIVEMLNAAFGGKDLRHGDFAHPGGQTGR